MPANRFAPDRIVRGHEQDARVIDRILQAILARWPIRKCDVESVYSAAIDWTDGATVPTENINVDELFNSATGIARALGCLDFINGLEVNYVDSSTISVSPGHVIHRGDFKILECDAANSDALFQVAASTVLDVNCPSVEGNPSGLDSDKWYFVYANMDASGGTPPIADFIRICDEAPVKCEGKGWEKADNTAWRFIGSIRTMASGEIRPFERADNGWVYWNLAAASSDYQTNGLMDAGTSLGFSSGGWVRYENAVSGVAYHDSIKHIPVTADFIRIAASDASVGGNLQVRSVRDDSGCTGWDLVANSADGRAYVTLPVNQPDIDPVDNQVFYINCASSHKLDVVGYHERLQ